PLGSIPACFHSAFSRLCVPELSPRDTKRDRLSAMSFIACTLLLVDLILAGAFCGPMMTETLFITGPHLTSLPAAAFFFVRLGAGARATCASPLAASSSAWPVPTEAVFTL